MYSLTLNDIPNAFLGQFLKNKRNATDKEIIDAYLEQQGKHVYWEDITNVINTTSGTS